MRSGDRFRTLFSSLSVSAVLLLFGAVLLPACKPTDKRSGSAPAPKSSQPAQLPAVRSEFLGERARSELAGAGIDERLFKKGERRYDLYCTACHQLEVGGSDHDPSKMLAPPAFGVAHHYRQRYADIDERIAAIKSFVTNPTEDKVIMPGAYRRFGAMLAINLPEDQLNEVAVFLATAEFKEPPWYRKHYEEEHGAPPSE